MKKFIPILCAIFVSLLSGCINLFGPETSIIYASSPTIIEYNVSYGYRLISEGGSFTLEYACPLPNPLDGEVAEINLLYPHVYKEKLLGENNFIEWKINGSGRTKIDVGIKAKILVKSFVVDLDKSKGVHLGSIPKEIIDRYCTVETTKDSEKPLIDPKNPEIENIALAIKGKDENAFSVAEKIFRWLKRNTHYKVHEEAKPQAAIDTLYLKSGDCDDLSFLYISLCRAAGVPARFVRGYIVDLSGGKAKAIPHAWAEVYVGFGKDGWIPVECSGTSKDVESEVYQNFGIEDAYHIRVFVDNGSNSSLEISSKGPLLWYSGEVSIEGFAEINFYKEICHGSLTIYPDGRREYKTK